MHPSFPAGENLLHESSPFHFACHNALPCFTQCCKDVNIYLTPYDVLRLRKALGIGSGEFLTKYTRSFLTKGTNIPVVQLLMDSHTLYCHLVTESGCSVYEDRPWACRMFPLDVCSTQQGFRLIAQRDRCMGFCDRGAGTVGSWLEVQGAGRYVEMERAFQSVVPARFKPGAAMNEGLGRLLFMAYDLDRFTEFLRDSRFFSFYEVDESMLRCIYEDDEELLKFAFKYIRSQMEDLYEVL